MSDTVWKFTLDVREAATWRLAIGGLTKVVAVRGRDAATLDVWVQLDPADAIRSVDLFIVGTGQPIPPDHFHVGTAFCDPFVWHVYRKREPTR